MLFNSLIFLIFIITVFLIYSQLRHRQQNLLLLVASYVFYSYWDWRFTILLLLSTITDFLIGQMIYASNKQQRRKILLFVSITVNLGILGFFKYFNFFIESTASILSTFSLQPNFPVLQVILPIGISFYTFKTLTYTIDIYKKKIQPTKDFVAYALFTSFFPQILAGPIDRAANLIPQITAPRQITRDHIIVGLNLILIGFFKKVAIADSLAPMVDKIFHDPVTMSSGQLWTGMYAYTIQIYGDFSGYTDIARGLAFLFGIKSIENFSTPYLSRSITEFWQRWHMSLSTWFRDYLYIPLGGNRSGKMRTYANLFITMLLCGLWHGAAWPFVIWGIVHGIFLISHRIILNGRKVNITWPNTFSGWALSSLKILSTFHLVAFAWVLFRSESLVSALTYYRGLFLLGSSEGFSSAVVFAGAMMLALDIAEKFTGKQTWLIEINGNKALRYAVAQFIIVSILVSMIAHLDTATPFIYFQF